MAILRIWKKSEPKVFTAERETWHITPEDVDVVLQVAFRVQPEDERGPVIQLAYINEQTRSAGNIRLSMGELESLSYEIRRMLSEYKPVKPSMEGKT